MPYLKNHYLPKLVRKYMFESELGKHLPQAYQKFYTEWKDTTPSPVHYIPEKEEWVRDPETDEMKRFQTIPIRTKLTPEMQGMLLGGEGIIMGFKHRGKYIGKVSKFWFPVFKKSVVISEILNQNLSVTLTDRVIHLIHQNYGFDHYILKTPSYDLQTLLALRLKRMMLHELRDKCPRLKDDPEKQAKVYETYKKYLDGYTDEDLEWYGLSYTEALKKVKQLKAANEPVPLKIVYRKMLIEQLKETALELEKKAENEPEPTTFDQIKNTFRKIARM